MAITAATHVKAVSWLMAGLGIVSLPIGCLMGGAMVEGDTYADDDKVKIAAALMLSGVLAVQAGLRNSRRQSWLFGLIALAGLGATGVLCLGPLTPHTIVAAYGLVVYLTPAGRAVFRSGAPPAESQGGGASP